MNFVADKLIELQIDSAMSRRSRDKY